MAPKENYLTQWSHIISIQGQCEQENGLQIEKKIAFGASAIPKIVKISFLQLNFQFIFRDFKNNVDHTNTLSKTQGALCAICMCLRPLN